MLGAAKYIFLIILFLMFYIGVRHLLSAFVRETKARFRLDYMKNTALPVKVDGWLSRYSTFYRHLTALLETTAPGLPPSYFLFISVLLLLTGCTTGIVHFQSLKGVVLLSLISGSLLYVVLRMKLMSLQFKTRIDFLPAVELFYQYYVLAGHYHIRRALQVAILENRLMYPARLVFEQLYRNLATQRDLDDSLRIFVMALGHRWAEYFASIIRIGLSEGIHIDRALKDLITEMRRAQRSDQVERNRLLEIRIANFTPIVFLAIFMGVNFKMNYENAHYFYLVDPVGKNMVLDSLLLIFASFIMGVYLSLKRM